MARLATTTRGCSGETSTLDLDVAERVVCMTSVRLQAFPGRRARRQNVLAMRTVIVLPALWSASSSFSW